jgi:hypothetical protein
MDMRRLVPAVSLVLVLTAANRSVAQVTANTLLPCCTIESLDPGAGMLALKNSASGERRSVQTPPTNYRLGQLVDLNTPGTAMALTPFPVKYQKENPKMHQNDAWKMRSTVAISAEGRIDGQTRIESSDPQQGFTGGVEVLLLDRSFNVLHHTNLRTYGVDANSARTVNWHETVPPTAVNKVRTVVLHHSHDPKVRLAAGVEWLKANSKDVSVVLACTPLADDGGGRRGARTPSLKPPGTSSIRCS